VDGLDQLNAWLINHQRQLTQTLVSRWPMAWGQWMIPQPGPEHQLTLERQRRAIQGYDLQQAQDALLRLCQLTMQQDLILRSATRHIAALECEAALRD